MQLTSFEKDFMKFPPEQTVIVHDVLPAMADGSESVVDVVLGCSIQSH